MDCARNGVVFQTAKWVQSITQESFQVSHLKDCISIQNLQHTRFSNLKRCRQCSHLSRDTGTRRKHKGFASGLRRWICFIQQSKPWLYTKRDRMCPDMLCVGVPLFITSNTSSAHCQYSASSPMQLNGVTATRCSQPRSHSQWFTI